MHLGRSFSYCSQNILVLCTDYRPSSSLSDASQFLLMLCGTLQIYGMQAAAWADVLCMLASQFLQRAQQGP